MNVSAWAIRNPVPIILLFAILTLAGVWGYRTLGINDAPDVDFPTIIVSVGQAGASPQELETEVTRKIEDSLVGLANLEHMRSTISEGASLTILEFKIGTRSETALNDVRDAISRIRQTLPQDINEPSITHPNFSGEPFAVYSIASDRRGVEELSRLIDDVLSPALLAVPGVGQVRRSGGLNREIRVELDPGRLRALGLTADRVNQQLRTLNINMPGGRANAGGQERSIRALGSAQTVEQLRATQITLPTGGTVRLDTLGEVRDTSAEVRQLARLDGKPAVAFSVVRTQGASLVSAEEAARKEVERLKREVLPSDLRMELIRTTADYSRARYSASRDALLIGATLAIIVIYLFLRNWQATLISAFAIPLSVIATFAVMKGLGYTLNNMTMLGLTLVVGILVDDAIVDLENIYRHISLGKSPMKAAIEATDEIGLAIVATTMTIAAVFIPVAFMGGIPGQFFRPFGVVVSVAVLFSLLVARTLTPMMAAYMLPRKAAGHNEEFSGQRYYIPVLNWALRHRKTTTALALVASVIMVAGTLPYLPKGLFSAGDIGEAIIAVNLPAGSTLPDTERVVAEVTSKLLARPETRRVFATVGSSTVPGSMGGSGGSVASGMVTVTLVPKHERKLSLDEFERAMLPEIAQIPGARIAFQHFGPGGSSKPVNMILRGIDPAALDRAADRLLTEMRHMPELRDVTSSAAELRPEIQIRPDFSRAAEQGVSVTSIGQVARIATQGDVEFNLAKFNAGNRQVNIRVQLAERFRDDVAAVGDLLVPSRNGPVPLRTVADVNLGTGPVQINRYDRARQVTLSANLTAGNLGVTMQKVKGLPAMKGLPPGVTPDTTGEAKVMADIFGAFVPVLIAAVIFIYAVLVLLFHDFLQPLTIMMALPLSVGGAMVGLYLGGKELGLMALIGIIMLMGLVTKNSILLVEYTIMARSRGMRRWDALIIAGKNRLRPILMTTIAMIAGMMPIALSIGEGTEQQSPMAVAVIGGLITSMLFTLVVIPAVYCFVDNLDQFISHRLGHHLQQEETDDEPGPPVAPPQEPMEQPVHG